MMNNFIRKVAVMLVAVTIVLSGCVATGEKKHNGGADISQTRIEASLIGAAIGAVAGALSGDNKKERVERTMIGAAVGGLAGLAMGELIARRQQGYATREAAIRTETEIVKRKTKELQAQNHQLAQDIRYYKQNIYSANIDYDSLQAQKIAVEKRHQEAQSLLKQVEDDLQQAKRQVQKKYQQNKVDASEVEKWKTQVASLEKEKQILQSNVDTLFAMTQSL